MSNDTGNFHSYFSSAALQDHISQANSKLWGILDFCRKYIRELIIGPPEPMWERRGLEWKWPLKIKSKIVFFINALEYHDAGSKYFQNQWSSLENPVKILQWFFEVSCSTLFYFYF